MEKLSNLLAALLNFVRVGLFIQPKVEHYKLY
jgi:hypothetical protein